jgi:hypothetical protein
MENYTKTMDTQTVLGMLQDLIHKEQEQSSRKEFEQRMHQRLVDELCDLIAVYELLLATQYHRPLFRPIGTDRACEVGQSRRYWRLFRYISHPRTHLCNADTLFTYRSTIDAKLDPENHGNLSVTGPWLKRLSALKTPAGTKDAACLADTKAFRDCLKTFWDKARMMHRVRCEASKMPEADIMADLTSMSFESSPRYLSDIEAEEDAVRIAVEVRSRNKAAAGPTLPEASYLTDKPSAEEVSRFLPSRPREKVKTRPDALGIQLSDNEQPSSSSDPSGDEDAEHVRVLAVKPESYAVFQRMFSSSGGPGTTKWRQLLDAMVDAGFSISARGGSVVNFNNDQKGTDFHRPRPVHGLSNIILSALGKRMTRHFGWTMDPFVLRERSENINKENPDGKKV